MLRPDEQGTVAAPRGDWGGHVPPTFLRDHFFNSSKSEENVGGYKDATFDS